MKLRKNYQDQNSTLNYLICTAKRAKPLLRLSSWSKHAQVFVVPKFTLVALDHFFAEMIWHSATAKNLNMVALPHSTSSLSSFFCSGIVPTHTSVTALALKQMKLCQKVGSIVDWHLGTTNIGCHNSDGRCSLSFQHCSRCCSRNLAFDVMQGEFSKFYMMAAHWVTISKLDVSKLSLFIETKELSKELQSQIAALLHTDQDVITVRYVIIHICLSLCI